MENKISISYENLTKEIVRLICVDKNGKEKELG